MINNIYIYLQYYFSIKILKKFKIFLIIKILRKKISINSWN